MRLARVERNGLRVDSRLAAFLEAHALPGTGVSQAKFWQAFSVLVHDYGRMNQVLLDTRTALQQKISAWHAGRRGQELDHSAYRAFLEEIGYLVPEGPDFRIKTANVDPELSMIPGPQLVVPITNARYAINAANSRWGSLYDALYGTDALGDAPDICGYDVAHGARVIAWARAHLDAVVPLAKGCWADIDTLSIEGGALLPRLADPGQFVGFRSEGAVLRTLLRVNGLHIEIVVDPSSHVGAQDRAGISDIRLEAAVSTIMDCEDSVAAVDGEDKTLAYANWLGLMRGDLAEEVNKAGRTFVRVLSGDLTYSTPEGGELRLKGRSMMLVRNVGLLMTSPAVLDRDGKEAFEGLMDAICTTLIAMHDLGRSEGPGNSPQGSIYVVKPKLHGPDEVNFTDQVFTFVESAFGLPRYTVKLGIMDEERRTSLNLKECIRAARNRVAFINTGFLDRTGDEIHTSSDAGPMIPKGDMKSSAWLSSYEDRNVDIGLACGFKGRAQIGKGMWAMPDRMADMLEQKIDHPLAGANCAWVPSPTAATLHATHYHRVNVLERQNEIAAHGFRGTMEDMLAVPLLAGRTLPEAEITAEIENNCQGILGYVVRWVDQGIGCSKVPDIGNVALMEDRATCRISSQALANWLCHGVVSKEQVMAALRRMAVVVDRQNKADPAYLPLAPEFDGIAFQAACDLVFRGSLQPSGYTEPVLHARRLQFKKAQRLPS